MEAVSAATVEAIEPGEECAVGRVMANIELINADDEAFVRAGQISLEKVRRIKVSALVDTGSTLLSLPEEDILKLGLPVYKTAVSRFANGQKQLRNVYGPVSIEVMGRRDSVLAVAGHPGTPPLLGQIPLEGLDLMVDSKRQRLVPGHPDHPDMAMYES